MNILLKEIEDTFPIVDMPNDEEISFHKDGCIACEYLRDDLHVYRNKEINGETIRLIHQDLSHLSAKSWRWIFPHYLRFCLTPEAQYNRMETEFLIYNLRPSLEFQQDALKRLSLFNKDQINTLIHFLEWCADCEYWKDYCLSDIENGKAFLRSLVASM